MIATLLQVFVLQVVVIALIIFILKKILDRQLTESALHKIETMNASAIDPDLKEISVVAYDALGEAAQKRITDSIFKKINKTVSLQVIVDKAIKGGIVITLNKVVVDHSLKGRLQEAGMMK